MAVHDNINHNSNKGAASDPVRLSLGIFGILLGITAVSGLVLSGTRTHADDTTQSDNVTVTVSSACTLSRSAGSGTYSATLNPGQETGDISGSTIKAICNDGNGYSLYAIGYSGDSYTGNNTKMIGTYGNIDTGTSGSDSWWAMKLAPVAGDHTPTIVNSFDSYHVVPATFTQVAKLTSATDVGESANGSSVDAFYKVKASTSQVAGTYTGKVKYVLVHPNANVAGTYTIAFNANGGTGTMASETGIYNFEEHTIKANEFTAPTGKVFGGWCTTNTSQSECTDGETYADGGTVLPSTVSANATLNLYAMWVNPPTMQEFAAGTSSTTCSTMSVNDTISLTDARDGESYLIGKLADNKCWMLDNLRLDLTNSTILNSLTTTNTHVDSASLTSLKSGNRSAGAQYASSGFATWNSSSSSSVYNQAKANADYKDTTTTSYGVGSGKIGIYYNYCAASAGSYCYDSGTPSSDPDTSTLQDAKYDLCPAGWRMPTSTNSGEYQALYAAYSSNVSDFQTALSTPLSGFFNNGSAYLQGSYGFFWSSTYYDDNRVYNLDVNSSNVNPSSGSNRGYGYSLRCLFSS